MLVKDKSQAVVSKSFLSGSLCSPLPLSNTTAQGLVGVPVGPVPRCMASFYSVMSMSNIKLSLGHGFPAHSALISVILVLSLDGLGQRNFGDGFRVSRHL